RKIFEKNINSWPIARQMFLDTFDQAFVPERWQKTIELTNQGENQDLWDYWDDRWEVIQMNEDLSWENQKYYFRLGLNSYWKDRFNAIQHFIHSERDLEEYCRLNRDRDERSVKPYPHAQINQRNKRFYTNDRDYNPSFHYSNKQDDWQIDQPNNQQTDC